MKLAIAIISYNRYFLASATLKNLHACKFKDTLFIIHDDASPNPKLHDLYARFSTAVQKQGNKCIVITREKHEGLPGLSLAFQSVLSKAKQYNCERILFTPDDLIYNLHIADVIERVKFEGSEMVATFWNDSRGELFGRNCKRNEKNGWHTGASVDGFAVLMPVDFALTLDWGVDMEKARATKRSMIWHKICRQLDAYTIRRTNESLCEHIGNIQNATHDRPKSVERKIWALNVNLFEVPEVLK